MVGDVTTVAGSPIGQFGYLDAQGTNARFNGGTQLAVFGGFTYVADFGNNAVRRIDGSGNVTTWPPGYTSFNVPTGLAVDTGGNLYVGNRIGNTIQKIDPAGIVTTVAGTGASGSNDGAAGAAVAQATFNQPQGLLFDAASNSLYIADSLGGRIRRLNLATSTVITLAGGGVAPGNVDDPTGTNARFSFPNGLAFGPAGTLYIADSNNNRIRLMSTTAPYAVTTVAGTGATGQNIGASVDGAALATAQFKNPYGVAFNPATGMLYISDLYNNQIRQLNTTSGVVSTLAGSGAIGGADGNGSNAQFRSPYGLTFAANGDLLVSEFFGHRVRSISLQQPAGAAAGPSTGNVAPLLVPPSTAAPTTAAPTTAAPATTVAPITTSAPTTVAPTTTTELPVPTATAPPASATVEAATATVSEPAFTG